MIQNKMILLDDPTRVMNVFLHLNSRPNKILLWQNVQGKGRRICQNARIGLINSANQEMSLYPTGRDFSFLHHSYLYFFGFNRTTIFKASILYHSQFKIVIRLPKQLMLANSRTKSREDVSLQDRFIFYTHHSYSDQPYLSSKLLDISDEGLSFRSSVHNIVRFKKGDRLWMRSPFHETRLLEGEVCNISKFSETHSQQNFLRVGVRYQ